MASACPPASMMLLSTPSVVNTQSVQTSTVMVPQTVQSTVMVPQTVQQTVMVPQTVTSVVNTPVVVPNVQTFSTVSAVSTGAVCAPRVGLLGRLFGGSTSKTVVKTRAF
jgi:hypothetical protein